MAVGRINKLHGKNEAEVAVLVSDKFQNLGLGYELLRRVIQIARDEKLSRNPRRNASRQHRHASHHEDAVGFKVRAGEDMSSIQAFLEL